MHIDELLYPTEKLQLCSSLQSCKADIPLRQYSQTGDPTILQLKLHSDHFYPPLTPSLLPLLPDCGKEKGIPGIPFCLTFSCNHVTLQLQVFTISV